MQLIGNETLETVSRQQRRTAERLIADLQAIALAMEDSLEEEISRSPVKDPNDVAYPLQARDLQRRLANVRATIASLERAA